MSASRATRLTPPQTGGWPAPEPIEVMGVPVVPFASYPEALNCVRHSVKTRRKSFWVAINPQKIHKAWHDRELHSLLTAADITICDGAGVSVASRILHGRGIPRCTGCDLFFEIMPVAAAEGWKVFLLGATPEANRLAAEKLRQRYPGLRIVGLQDGYFEDSAAVVEKINASGADLLFVAMGSPRQEFWIRDHHHRINAPFCMGVGGTFDVAGGTSKRAPRIMRKLGTEFLYQLLTQPHRWRRQIVYFPYMFRVLRAKLTASSPETN